jgi:hypothetical protein
MEMFVPVHTTFFNFALIWAGRNENFETPFQIVPPPKIRVTGFAG